MTMKNLTDEQLKLLKIDRADIQTFLEPDLSKETAKAGLQDVLEDAYKNVPEFRKMVQQDLKSGPGKALKLVTRLLKSVRDMSENAHVFIQPDPSRQAWALIQETLTPMLPSGEPAGKPGEKEKLPTLSAQEIKAFGLNPSDVDVNVSYHDVIEPALAYFMGVKRTRENGNIKNKRFKNDLTKDLSSEQKKMYIKRFLNEVKDLREESNHPLTPTEKQVYDNIDRYAARYVKDPMFTSDITGEKIDLMEKKDYKGKQDAIYPVIQEAVDVLQSIQRARENFSPVLSGDLNKAGEMIDAALPSAENITSKLEEIQKEVSNLGLNKLQKDLLLNVDTGTFTLSPKISTDEFNRYRKMYDQIEDKSSPEAKNVLKILRSFKQLADIQSKGGLSTLKGLIDDYLGILKDYDARTQERLGGDLTDILDSPGSAEEFNSLMSAVSDLPRLFNRIARQSYFSGSWGKATEEDEGGEEKTAADISSYAKKLEKFRGKGVASRLEKLRDYFGEGGELDEIIEKMASILELAPGTGVGRIDVGKLKSQGMDPAEIQRQVVEYNTAMKELAPIRNFLNPNKKDYTGNPLQGQGIDLKGAQKIVTEIKKIVEDLDFKKKAREAREVLEWAADLPSLIKPSSRTQKMSYAERLREWAYKLGASKPTKQLGEAPLFVHRKTLTKYGPKYFKDFFDKPDFVESFVQEMEKSGLNRMLLEGDTVDPVDVDEVLEKVIEKGGLGKGKGGKTLSFDQLIGDKVKRHARAAMNLEKLQKEKEEALSRVKGLKEQIDSFEGPKQLEKMVSFMREPLTKLRQHLEERGGGVREDIKEKSEERGGQKAILKRLENREKINDMIEKMINSEDAGNQYAAAWMFRKEFPKIMEEKDVEKYVKDLRETQEFISTYNKLMGTDYIMMPTIEQYQADYKRIGEEAEKVAPEKVETEKEMRRMKVLQSELKTMGTKIKEIENLDPKEKARLKKEISEKTKARKFITDRSTYKNNMNKLITLYGKGRKATPVLDNSPGVETQLPSTRLEEFKENNLERKRILGELPSDSEDPAVQRRRIEHLKNYISSWPVKKKALSEYVEQVEEDLKDHEETIKQATNFLKEHWDKFKEQDVVQATVQRAKEEGRKLTPEELKNLLPEEKADEILDSLKKIHKNRSVINDLGMVIRDQMSEVQKLKTQIFEGEEEFESYKKELKEKAPQELGDSVQDKTNQLISEMKYQLSGLEKKFDPDALGDFIKRMKVLSERAIERGAKKYEIESHRFLIDRLEKEYKEKMNLLDYLNNTLEKKAKLKNLAAKLNTVKVDPSAPFLPEINNIKAMVNPIVSLVNRGEYPVLEISNFGNTITKSIDYAVKNSAKKEDIQTLDAAITSILSAIDKMSTNAKTNTPVQQVTPEDKELMARIRKDIEGIEQKMDQGQGTKKVLTPGMSKEEQEVLKEKEASLLRELYELKKLSGSINKKDTVKKIDFLQNQLRAFSVLSKFAADDKSPYDIALETRGTDPGAKGKLPWDRGEGFPISIKDLDLLEQQVEDIKENMLALDKNKSQLQKSLEDARSAVIEKDMEGLTKEQQIKERNKAITEYSDKSKAVSEAMEDIRSNIEGLNEEFKELAPIVDKIKNYPVKIEGMEIPLRDFGEKFNEMFFDYQEKIRKLTNQYEDAVNRLSQIDSKISSYEDFFDPETNEFKDLEPEELEDLKKMFYRRLYKSLDGYWSEIVGKNIATFGERDAEWYNNVFRTFKNLSNVRSNRKLMKLLNTLKQETRSDIDDLAHRFKSQELEDRKNELINRYKNLVRGAMKREEGESKADFSKRVENEVQKRISRSDEIKGLTSRIQNLKSKEEDINKIFTAMAKTVSGETHENIKHSLEKALGEALPDSRTKNNENEEAEKVLETVEINVDSLVEAEKELEQINKAMSDMTDKIVSVEQKMKKTAYNEDVNYNPRILYAQKVQDKIREMMEAYLV